MKPLYWMADTFPFLTSIAPFRIISFILFITAWITGEVSGWMAWAILFLITDLKFDIRRPTQGISSRGRGHFDEDGNVQCDSIEGFDIILPRGKRSGNSGNNESD